MLVDLLSSDNYICINLSLVNSLGLTCAAYCSELMSIYKKAKAKGKCIDDSGDYFVVDRKYVSKKLQISVKDQYVLDATLKQYDLISVYSGDINKTLKIGNSFINTSEVDNKDIIKIYIEKIIYFISGEDISSKDLSAIKTSINFNKDEARAVNQANTLGNKINVKDIDLNIAYKKWIKTMVVDCKRMRLNAEACNEFINEVHGFAGNNKELELKLINIAICNGFNLFSKIKAAYEQEVGKSVRTHRYDMSDNTATGIGKRGF